MPKNSLSTTLAAKMLGLMMTAGTLVTETAVMIDMKLTTTLHEMAEGEGPILIGDGTMVGQGTVIVFTVTISIPGLEAGDSVDQSAFSYW